MDVSYHNPGILIIGGVAAAIVCLIAFRLKIKKDDRASLRVANTKRLKENPLYRRKLVEIRLLRILTAAGLILAIVAALFLTARPFKRETLKDTVNRRDIFLCECANGDKGKQNCNKNLFHCYRFYFQVSNIINNRLKRYRLNE